ncbi:unnamed protein product [Moneuplotes crassus]|uniref:Uncharacterized protein n=1 Tax=Euplotes crassus TaxID=5936 RepID=A0AAD1XGG3_EUPCR|nr:unnamed protein product [Moneuplotes crassus]
MEKLSKKNKKGFKREDSQIDSITDSRRRHAEFNQLKCLKETISEECMALNAKYKNLRKEISDLKSTDKKEIEQKQVIQHLKDSIVTTTLEYNQMKEQNKVKEEELDKLKEFQQSLNKNIEFADTEVIAHFLEDNEFLQNKVVDGVHNPNQDYTATELFVMITEMLKKLEKQHNFNAIDPIDEERDHLDLKHKIDQLILQRKHLQAMGIKNEERLSGEEQEKIHRIDDCDDLNEVKLLEDRLLKMLENLGEDTTEYRQECDKDSLELADTYHLLAEVGRVDSTLTTKFTKTILKARGKMIESKADLLEAEKQYHSAKHKVLQQKLEELEKEIFGTDQEPF